MTNKMIRRTSIAIQKIHQKHEVEHTLKKQSSNRMKELHLISGDARIGRGYDFHSGQQYDDKSFFEKERTLLELWTIYRNGYTSDEVLKVIYIPIIVIEAGAPIRCTSEKFSVDQTVLHELRARYEEIREEARRCREEEEQMKYEEINGISRKAGAMEQLGKELFDTFSRSPSPQNSRPRSMISYRDSPYNMSMEQEYEQIIKKDPGSGKSFFYFCCCDCFTAVED